MRVGRIHWRFWCITCGVIAMFSICLTEYFFSQKPFWFQLNALQVIAIPLLWIAGAFAMIFWVGSMTLRSKATPTSVRELLVGVALIGFGLGLARWWVRYNFETVYSADYREDQFRRVHQGMTAAEVESILGLPIQKDSSSQRWGPCENWIYSEPPPPGTLGDNYWRRWVMFQEGKVVTIVDDYYWD